MNVSVIVPTRDRPALLARCLQQLLRQHHAGLEVVVVDDGSGELARQQVRQLAAASGARVRLVELGAAGGGGQGPGHARNVGIAAAAGDLIGFCDDDDEWSDPEHLSRAVACLAAAPDVGLYVGNQIGVRDGVVVIDNWLSGLPRASADSPVMLPAAALCQAHTFPHLNTVLARRSALPQPGPFWTAVRYEEDRDFFWRLLDRCERVAVCFKPVAVHHVPDPALQHNASTQHGRRDRLLISAMVARHIALAVRQPALVRLVRHAEGDVSRQLAEMARDEGRRSAARSLAWTALAQRFSWKWLALCCWLSLPAWRPEGSP